MVTLLRGRDTRPQTVHRPGGERHESPTAEWVPTTCRMCLVGCGILVKVENGRVANVIGNPDTPKNRGRMCAKGKSGIMNHYNVNRVTTPLKRTNPEKGIGVDPGWQPISWEEAIETVSAKLRQVIADDPRKLYVQTWGLHDLRTLLGVLTTVVGSPYHQTGISGTCGKTIHSIQFLTAGGLHQEPDFAHCNYLIDCGTQIGVATREGFNHQVPDCARARERGMKLVVVDPIGNNAAAKADEWLPIRPGTDAAFGLGMLNVLLNEVKIYDVEFLKHHTNAGYLAGPNKKYVRDQATRKPLLYDLSDGVVKAYDDATLADPALEGEYVVQGERARPAFVLLKERAAQYPPERVEEITSIPAATLRRIAREFGEAARVGAMATIDGVEVPYRPVALEWCRGPQGHKHAWHHTWALHLVNLVLGAINVVGSLHSTDTAKNWPVRNWPEAGEDGLLMSGGHIGRGYGNNSAFPGRPAHKPERCDLFELFPVARHTRTFVPEVARHPDKYGIVQRVELVIHSPGNQIMGGWGELQAVADWYRSVDLVVGFAVELNETHELDDVVLPAPTYLEEDSFTGTHGDDSPVSGEAVGFHQIQQKVVPPPEGVRDPVDVLLEVYHRAGILDETHPVMNRVFGLKAPYLLEPGKRYSHEELLDRQFKSRYGEEFGWGWFKEHGVLVHKRDVDERYPGRFLKARVPVYLEHFVERGEEVEAVVGEMGLSWDLSEYDPLPEWRSCEPFVQLQKGEIDAIGVHYKLPYTYGAQGNANPWIDELCERLPHSYGVLIHEALARRKGIKDGDAVWLESPVRRVKAVARVTQMVHPEVVGIAGHAGHWAQGKPLSRGKGVNFNSLLPYGPEKMDVISTALDHCAPLKVSRA
ncbi:MAG: molybdopterin-dependent oxidoreductase [Chloroflexi bacterium]|nr:molybdopterin-dependent oxidoreductase [Chloroflexota bacterium]